MSLNKFEDFVKDYDFTKFEALPKFIKRRVDALKKIQLEHVQIQHQYHLELQELEFKYEKLYKPLYEKRFQIISGAHEPTEEECQLPANASELDGDQENAVLDISELIFDESDEAELKSKVKGIPAFWLGCLASTFNFDDSIEEHDRAVLRYLQDIRVSYAPDGDCFSYTLEFLFDENPYFTNKQLTKTYHLKSSPNDRDPFSYDGYEVVKSEGCEINWNPGKNVSTKTILVKQQNKNDGRTREKRKEVERESFFYFFKPPELPAKTQDDSTQEEIRAIMAVDFELGEIIRQSLIPAAALYYTGYMNEEEDDSEDDDDCDDEDDDDDDDDEDEEDSDSDAPAELNDSDDSDDSLDQVNDKKHLHPGKKGPKRNLKSK